jgi:acyl-CoA synthetase (AMP-forming)/AMP-acid ligase II
VSAARPGWHARAVNVADLVRAAAAEHGDRAAFRTLDGATLTWAEVDARVDETAATLRGHGAQPGDRIAIALPNSPAFAVAFWGALRADTVVVPVNPAYTPREHHHILHDSTASFSITTPDLRPASITIPQSTSGQAGEAETAKTEKAGGSAGGSAGVAQGGRAGGA